MLVLASTFERFRQSMLLLSAALTETGADLVDGSNAFATNEFPLLVVDDAEELRAS